MKAILNNDIILDFKDEGVEIGALIRGVPLTRLRFDGTKMVDLYGQTQYYVESIQGIFILHVVFVPNSQLVQMVYRERKHLYTDENGIIKVRTKQEIVKKDKRERRQLLKNRLRQTVKKDHGELEDQVADLTKLVLALIIYTRTGNTQLEIFFDELIPDATNVYPLARIKKGIKRLVKGLRTRMTKYYQDLDDIG